MRQKLIRLLMEQFPDSDSCDHQETADKILALLEPQFRTEAFNNQGPAIEGHTIPQVRKITPRSVMREEEES